MSVFSQCQNAKPDFVIFGSVYQSFWYWIFIFYILHLQCQNENIYENSSYLILLGCDFTKFHWVFNPIAWVWEGWLCLHLLNPKPFNLLQFWAKNWLWTLIPRKIYTGSMTFSHFTDTNNISWHEMMACHLIFVQPIRGLISGLDR